MDDLDSKLKDILKDPLFKDVEFEDLSLFNVPEYLDSPETRDKADYIAQRTRCENFYLYERGFKLVHKDLNDGKRSLIKYQPRTIKPDMYFMVDGQLCYLDDIGDLQKDVNRVLNGRIRLIYENGTETDILLETLRKNLAKEGFIVTESEDESENYLRDQFSLYETDRKEGYIYVLQSKSKCPEIASVKDLYKIGFTTQTVEERIANAKEDPTYLMDEVKIISTWETYNANTNKLEALIHQFFASAKWNVQLKDMNNKVYTPQEWYVVPFGIIESVIKKIEDRSIVNYRYNRQLQSLESIVKDTNGLNTDGMNILSLSVKRMDLQSIRVGETKVLMREVRESNKNKFIEQDFAENKMYLKRYDALRLQVRGNKECAIIQVVNTTYNPINKNIEYTLGQVLEVDGVKTYNNIN